MYKSSITDASNFVSGVDSAFIFILSISLVFLVGLTILMLYFVFRYNKKRSPQAKQNKDNIWLEIIWTGIPTILVLLMFYYGWVGWNPMKNIPDDAMEVETIARMWNFQFKYENGKRTDTLYVPMNKAVKLKLTALDVIHGIYIPAFRVKEDMVPGKTSYMWFNPMRPGKFDLFCSEYCGLQHSYMYSSVVVMPEEEFNKWYIDTTKVEKLATNFPGAEGKSILQKQGCIACHSLDGSKLIGPSFKNIYSRERTVLEKGKESVIKTSFEYIQESIYFPDKKVNKGYTKGMMLSYKDLISDDEIKKIDEYLQTLSE